MLPDILLLVCDTARADAFSPWGGMTATPRIEQLANEGIVFEQAISAAPWTLPSHGSLFTGLLPTEHGITGERLTWTPDGPSAPATLVASFGGPWLPEALQERGYRTVGVTCNPWVGTWGGFDRGFERFVDVRPRTLPRGRAQRLAGRARRVARGGDHGGAAAVAALREAVGSDGPTFAFVNLMEVHSPYDPPPDLHPARGASGTAGLRLRYRQLRQMGGFRTRTDPGYTADLRALYAATAEHEDRLVDQVVRVFLGRGRPAVVVLVSDHGENLGDHGLWGHHSSLHETLLHVPLLVWDREVGLGRERVAQPISTARLAPWFLDLADGARDAPRPDSAPLVAEYESAVAQFGQGVPPEVRSFLGGGTDSLVTSAGLAIRTDREKYIALEAGKEFLFDLSTDPIEEHNVLQERPSAAAAFRPHAEAWRSRRGRLGEAAGSSLGEALEDEIASHLRDLGYID